MNGMEDIRTVREIMNEKREKARAILPVSKSAQKEYIRDWLARNQEQFDICMNQLAECDPKTFATIYKDLTKHMIPKQSEVSVTHGLDNDFKELMALGRTKVDEGNLLNVEQAPRIENNDFESTDFEELEELGNGNGG